MRMVRGERDHVFEVRATGQRLLRDAPEGGGPD
jgi:hypothetical protein